MQRPRKISILTLILFALIVLYHTYLDVTGTINLPKEVLISINQKFNSDQIIRLHQFELLMAITFSKFVILGSLVFLCYYNRLFINTVIMWIVGSFIFIIESSIRLLSDKSEYISLIITLNFVGLIVGFAIMYGVLHVLYTLITDVSMNKN